MGARPYITRTPLRPYTRAGLSEAWTRELFARSCLRFVGNGPSWGRPIELEPWERRYIWYPLFGTGRVGPDGRFRRRYHEAVISMKRDEGKSLLASAIVLSEASCNVKEEGQYGIFSANGALSEKVKGYLSTMVRLSPELSKGWRPYRERIVNIETGQEIWALPATVSAAQSRHFDVAVADELHVWTKDGMWDAIVSSQSELDDAMLVGISTAGDHRGGFWWELFDQCRHGGIPERYFWWAGIDDWDDASDRRCWRKAMPSPRDTMEKMERARSRMEASPRAFERYHLNRFPLDAAAEPFFRLRDVEACRRLGGSIDRGRYYVIGIDGAVSGDVMAAVAVQEQDGEPVFEEWVWAKTTEDGVYDMADLADLLVERSRDRGRPDFVADPARLVYMVNRLRSDYGVEVAAVAQSNANMCPASELLWSYVKARTAHMGGTPTLAEHCLNAVADVKASYGRRISSTGHGRGSARIDAAIAAAMALRTYEAEAPTRRDWSRGIAALAI